MEFKLNFKDKKYILVKVKTSKQRLNLFLKYYLSLPFFPAKALSKQGTWTIMVANKIDIDKEGKRERKSKEEPKRLRQFQVPISQLMRRFIPLFNTTHQNLNSHLCSHSHTHTHTLPIFSLIFIHYFLSHSFTPFCL